MDNVSAIDNLSSSSLKNHVQAMMKISHVWAAGYRNISEIMATASQAHLDHVSTTLKAMSDVRTIKGAMEIQMSATCTLVQHAFTNAGKIITASMEVADQGMAPVRARIDTTMARLGSTKFNAPCVSP